MWSYYGSKKSIIDKYPPPKYGKIIEPFAGVASYSMKYWDRVIVCENSNATWMDFKPMILNKGTHKSRTEVIWSNLPIAFDNIQQKLF